MEAAGEFLLVNLFCIRILFPEVFSEWVSWQFLYSGCWLGTGDIPERCWPPATPLDFNRHCKFSAPLRMSLSVFYVPKPENSLWTWFVHPGTQRYKLHPLAVAGSSCAPREMLKGGQFQFHPRSKAARKSTWSVCFLGAFPETSSWPALPSY